MSVQRYCPRCGKPLSRDEHGDMRCPNEHTPEHDAVTAALIGLMPVLVELRGRLERIEEQGERTEIHVEGLREEVKALRLERTTAGAAEYNDLATEARRIGRSRDWLRDHARDLGGTQTKPRGRWYFPPAVTDARLAALEGGEAKPARLAPPARPLPGSVPLLPVKDRAA